MKKTEDPNSVCVVSLINTSLSYSQPIPFDIDTPCGNSLTNPETSHEVVQPKRRKLCEYS